MKFIENSNRNWQIAPSRLKRKFPNCILSRKIIYWVVPYQIKESKLKSKLFQLLLRCTYIALTWHIPIFFWIGHCEILWIGSIIIGCIAVWHITVHLRFRQTHTLIMIGAYQYTLLNTGWHYSYVCRSTLHWYSSW